MGVLVMHQHAGHYTLGRSFQVVVAVVIQALERLTFLKLVSFGAVKRRIQVQNLVFLSHDFKSLSVAYRPFKRADFIFFSYLRNLN